jgi:arsenate reductase
MAAALFNRLADPARARAISAGTAPAARVHPEVVNAMAEMGIDLSDGVPQRLTTALAETADILVTMGCGDACPLVPGARRLDWNLPDPHGRPVDEVREIRDTIRRQVVSLIDEAGLNP